MDLSTAEVEAAVGEVLARYVDKIRAKARDDIAAELDQAGHTAAAEYVRDHR